MTEKVLPVPRAEDETITCADLRDEAVYEECVRRYYHPVRCLVAAKVGADEAEDVVQEIFYALYRRRDDLRWSLEHHDVKVILYIMKCVRNLELRGRRDAKREARGLGRYLERLKERVRSWRTGEQVVQIGELQSAYAEVVATLPPRARETWCLAVEQELPRAEVARIMECSEKTVYAQLERAQKRIRTGLRARGYDRLGGRPA